MKRNLFLLDLKESLINAGNLSEVEEMLINQAKSIEKEGKRLGFVVGKITPLEGEQLAQNKALLARRTEEIAVLVEPQGIIIFSSAAVPDSIEGKFPLSDFYNVFNRLISKYVKVIITTEGWEHSFGASNEVKIARKKKNIDIFHYRNGLLEKE